MFYASLFHFTEAVPVLFTLERFHKVSNMFHVEIDVEFAYVLEE